MRQIANGERQDNKCDPVCERRRQVGGRKWLKREKAAILTCRTEGGAKGQGVDYYLRENEFGELGATIDTIIWFPELRTES